YMALICNFSGETKLAFKAVSRSLELIPEADTEFRSFAYYTRGMLLKNYHQWELAEADFTEAIRSNPNDVENYTCRAEVLLQLHEYEAALDDLTAALKLDSKADVADLMMQLMEEAPDTGMIDRISATYEMLNNQELSN
ncbi:MAG: tetratricopeptide repeat protein, partial [Bacteroides sp.]|nr:tetratricopeptide repeat protein [Bacteroides sp.]